MVLLATSTTGTPATGYIIAVLAIMFGITFSLRALPFAILAKLRDSQFVNIMALWMPAGILALLAIALFYSTYSAPDTVLWKLLTAVGVTIASHLLLGRRTLVSIGLGTVTYVMLVNFIG
ncbi:MAG TPA: AzlD domain-containing protein [Candidatus Yaniella excrementigallinarum]|nr:AzlD domain-containing protein [Candidatus Yaniella excrementigallinarum]